MTNNMIDANLAGAISFVCIILFFIVGFIIGAITKENEREKNAKFCKLCGRRLELKEDNDYRLCLVPDGPGYFGQGDLHREKRTRLQCEHCKEYETCNEKWFKGESK